MSTVWWAHKDVPIFALDLEKNRGNHIIQIGMCDDYHSHGKTIYVRPPDYDEWRRRGMGSWCDRAGEDPSEFERFAQPIGETQLYHAMTNAIVLLYNKGNDKRLLKDAFVKCGYKGLPDNTKFICVYDLVRRLEKDADGTKIHDKETLQQVAEFYQVWGGNFMAHNAKWDAIATWRLFMIMMNRHPDYFQQHYNGYMTQRDSSTVPSWYTSSRIHDVMKLYNHSGGPQPQQQQRLPICPVSMLITATHNDITYEEATQLHRLHPYVAAATGQVSKWLCEDTDNGVHTPEFSKRGHVSSLHDVLEFFMRTDERIQHSFSFFSGEHWNTTLFQQVGHQGPDPRNVTQLLKLANAHMHVYG